jgi:hypothetical protein
MITMREGHRVEPHDCQWVGLDGSSHFLAAAPGPLAPYSNEVLDGERGRRWHMTNGSEAADPIPGDGNHVP